MRGRTRIAAVLAALTLMAGVALTGAMARANDHAPAEHAAQARPDREAAAADDGAEPAAVEESPFTEVTAFATKTGFRGVVVFAASEPVLAAVNYGTDPADLGGIAVAEGGPDTAGLVILDGLTVGETYYYEVVDQLSGASAGVHSFEAVNAYNDHGPNTEQDPTETSYKSEVYTIDLLVQLDTQSLPPEINPDQAIEEIAQSMSITAERVYDALDGHARVGRVLVTDTAVGQVPPVGGVLPVHVRGTCPTPSTLADVLVTTVLPFDSHTFGWAIAEPCTSFYIGRLGWLVANPWQGDLDVGYTSTHELMHYAFGAPDLYPPFSDGDCKNLSWDGSLMHNTGGWNGARWELTEVDESASLTPCDMGSEPFTWASLQERYTAVPDRSRVEDVVNTAPRGNPDGSALEILVLDREPGASTLTRFTPDDSGTTGPACPARPGDGTSFVDEPGDATQPAGESETNVRRHDILSAAVSWVDDGRHAVTAADTVRFEIEVDELDGLPAPGSTGDFFDFVFSTPAGEYYAAASWMPTNGPDPGTSAQYTVGRQEGNSLTTIAPVAGSWDTGSDLITIDVPAVVTDEDGATVFEFPQGSTIGGFSVNARRRVVALLVVTDSAAGGCPVAIPGVSRPASRSPQSPPDSESYDATLRPHGRPHAWTGSPFPPAMPMPVGGCLGPDSPFCDHERIWVSVSGSTLTITVDFPQGEDFDVYLYGPDGSLVRSAASEANPEQIVVDDVPAGGYTVSVLAWLTTGSSYAAVAELD